MTDQIARLRRRDYTPSDVASQSLRLVIAVPVSTALSSAAAPNLSVAIAFGLGAFPTATLLKYLGRFTDRSTNLGDSKDTNTGIALEKLQGVGRPEAERLAAEGVTSILSLAYTDPIALALRSNFAFDFITDLASQALLWTYTADMLESARKVGIRGAVEANNLFIRLQAEEGSSELKHARATLDELAKAIGVHPSVVHNMLEEVVSDPFTEFICELWVEADQHKP